MQNITLLQLSNFFGMAMQRHALPKQLPTLTFLRYVLISSK